MPGRCGGGKALGGAVTTSPFRASHEAPSHLASASAPERRAAGIDAGPPLLKTGLEAAHVW